MGWVEDKLDKKLEHVVDTVTTESLRTRAELAAAFAESLRGSRLTGALARPIRANADSYGAGGRLVGWSLRSVTADVTVNFRDGRDTDADPIATEFIPAGTAKTVSMPGVSFVDRLYTEVITAGGTVFGAVWIGATD